jgi:hypothetical protein
MRNRAAVAFLIAPIALQVAWAASYRPPPDSNGGWRTLTGESSDKLLNGPRLYWYSGAIAKEIAAKP